MRAWPEMPTQTATLQTIPHYRSPGIGSSDRVKLVFDAIGVPSDDLNSGQHAVYSPIDGQKIANIDYHSAAQCEARIAAAQKAFADYRMIPAPRRGELVRVFADVLRTNKDVLAAMVVIESGKIWTEAKAEVQEMIDVCDFGVGLSRQLYGLNMGSERAGHRLSEFWYPAGVVGVISAFNFPAAVWAWNTVIALVCGDTVVWKPSEKAPLTAILCSRLLQRAIDEFGEASPDIHQLVIGDYRAGHALASDRRVPIVSATGSTPMGRHVAQVVANRFGRCILELGGNNALIVTPSADLEMATESIVFSAAGTTGQRCTSLRRLIVHESIIDELQDSVLAGYERLAIGDPFDALTQVGPLISKKALDTMQIAISALENAKYRVIGGQRVEISGLSAGSYVRPAIVRVNPSYSGIQRELFAPLLYVIPYSNIEQAIEIQNDVPQGLSSSIFSNDLRETERFLSVAGSDCGIANVNTGPSGAEIGGAFGGEKETGGGRECGSDSWKSYMRRLTATINSSTDLPLAQGVEFRLQSNELSGLYQRSADTA